jgi:glycine N-methyltransferase
MLLEEGFQVTSIDASDKMLKYALKKRWDRRKEEAFDKWGNRLKFHMFKKASHAIFNVICVVVEEANWLALDSEADFLKEGFDAVICLGNSFAHLPDFEGDLRNQRFLL